MGTESEGTLQTVPWNVGLIVKPGHAVHVSLIKYFAVQAVVAEASNELVSKVEIRVNTSEVAKMETLVGSITSINQRDNIPSVCRESSINRQTIGP